MWRAWQAPRPGRGAAPRRRAYCWPMPDAPSHGFARELFLRLLGGVYLCAFASLWVQLDGLIGSGGVLPARAFLANVAEHLGGPDPWQVPTLCWLNAGDATLHGLCAGGCGAAVLLMAGVAPALCLLVLWLGYLSLCAVGQSFFHFQWDLLLLEAGLLALLVAPWRLRPRWLRTTAPDPFAWWLLRWLLFRLMLLSGVVKLASHDPTWRDFTALQFHYWTQPLPAWTSWYAHQLPGAVHGVAQGVMLAIELVAPFLLFCGRGGRRLAALLFLELQVAIAATGNYGFFNLLTCVVCVAVCDDPLLLRLLPQRLRARHVCQAVRWPRVRAAVLAPAAGALLLLSTAEALQRVLPTLELPAPVTDTLERLAPLRSVNSYGLFAVMTTTRPELEVQGSDDGVHWQPYEFRWKPGALGRAPAVIGPHLPRLDWQMWFAALGSPGESRWIYQLVQSLLEARPAVLALLAHDPFGGRPPRAVRIRLWQYRFATAAERRASGAWWQRAPEREWLPALALEGGRLVRAQF